jgi:uncharacterized protein (TIGR00730 family)
MSPSKLLRQRKLAEIQAELRSHAAVDARYAAPGSSYRFAFTDQDFLTRRETRGMRLQLEYAKADLVQQEMGVDSTIVVFGSARFLAPEQAEQALAAARASGEAARIAQAERQLANSRYYAEAQRLGQLVAAHSQCCMPDDRLVICTGGGPGIMEAANRGAFEAGGLSMGLNIALPHEQRPNPYLTPELCFQFHYFALRKMHFFMRAKALVAFPGGFGTLDELFETLTLIQTRKSERVPILLFDRDWWLKLIDFDFLVESQVISPEDKDLITFVSSAEEAWQSIRGFYRI